MKIAGYEFVEGARFQGGAVKDAAAVGERLEKLRREQKGELTPQDVVDDARKKTSPLHTFFEWDDGAAAEQHRLAQARGLIRAVVAVYVNEKQPARRMHAFVHIPEGETSHYRATHLALGTEKTRDVVLRQAWREFQGWRRRYADLKEFSELFIKADEVEKRLAAAKH